MMRFRLNAKMVWAGALAIAALCALGIADAAQAQTLSLNMGETGGSATGRMVQLLLLVTVITLAPSILIMVTSFTRIVVVLSFLRNAIGLQQTPPNQVIISLSLFLTAFVMMPTFEDAYHAGIVPLVEERISEQEAVIKTAEPFRVFMLKHTRDKDLKLFIDMLPEEDRKIETADDTPYRVLIPAFMISELKRAFEIAFLLFLPFLVIDMLVASVLMAMGMMMLPPVLISLPFKLIFFVLVDGWHMVCGSLVKSYGG